ncbi:hypothetical protein [Acinetobacter baumannii]|uniref:hypothetical protein n=3 Tax=Acinetobacter baumannii TaxID=470 RepID=UPI000D6591E1|nr:hypothetical protein [Acinetobacter baumannii]MCQ4667568.1 hypothetical protein [Acinetobacter baumannii]MCQ4713754.1 hypothetical protein [Acinetobacter baumannii]MCQ4729675.1 hypothetical protein [Acinetobacter baumannii]MCQ4747955.1 hypothetical protein [Acinetobacter baumannii]MCT9121318.1 hypothetical protein [Acinetobacter baumannii]
MKPEQFIREQGVEGAREVVEGAPDLSLFYDLEKQKHVLKESTSIAMAFLKNRFLPIEDLKRLVESVELINLFGSIKIAKDKVKMADFNGFLLVSVPIENGLADVYIHKVEQAIRDHESIYGGGDE